MDDLKKYRGYLFVAVFLIVIKAVWLPLWDAKQESWNTAENLQRQLDKANALLQQQSDIQINHNNMQELLKSIESDLTEVSDPAIYKVSVQTDVEKLLNQYNVQLTSSLWRDGLREGDVQIYYLDINFSGKMVDFLRFTSAFIKDKTFALCSMGDLQLMIRGQRATELGEVAGKFSIRVVARLARDA